MKESTASGNLSKGDIISFISLLILGALVFFGMNFMTLGDKAPSIVVAVVIVIVMSTCIFLAAYAKAQDRNQNTWKKIEYAMVIVYILLLAPCYFFVGKFFDVQFDKESVLKEVNNDTNDLNKMFSDYNRKAESRASAYQIELESLLKSEEGRQQLATLLDIQNPESITKENVNQAVVSFSKNLKGAEYKSLEAEKNNLLQNVDNNFNNWNIMYIPQYAYELGNAKNKYATELGLLYEKTQNSFEKNIPEFDAESYANESKIVDKFKNTDRFSIIGLIVVLFLGMVGMVKYILGEKSKVVQMKAGSSSSITEDGGITL